MSYFVYENYHHGRATVHDGRCGCCNDGAGVHPDRTDDNSKWLGPFMTAKAAFAAARSTGRSVRVCGLTGPCRALPRE